MTAALHLHKIGPTKPEQVEVGAYYLVKGTNSFNEAIPPQIIQIWTVPRRTFTVSPHYSCEAMSWMALPGMEGIYKIHNLNYPLGAVNVTGTGVYHDRHLVRIDPDDWAAAHAGDYYWILRGIKTPNIVVD